MPFRFMKTSTMAIYSKRFRPTIHLATFRIKPETDVAFVEGDVDGER